MPKKSAPHIPQLKLHKPTGQARVIINGQHFYLGQFGSDEAEERYKAAIAEWLVSGRLPETKAKPGPVSITINEVILAWWKHAQVWYRKNGKPTTELDAQRQTLKVLRELYGSTCAEEFGPLKLKAVRQKMVEKGWVRGEVNHKIRRIKRMFKWAAENEIVSATIWHSLQTVAGLVKGRCEAVESEPVMPVRLEVVEATLPHLSRQVADMVRLQLLTGCRPGEICSLRPADVNRTSEIWEYVPLTHKTEHHGKERIIFIGPEAQAILSPYLLRTAESHCFSPAEAEKERKAEMREQRKTKVQPSQVDRSKPNPRKQPGTCYDVHSYRRAIKAGCEIAFHMPEELRKRPSKLTAQEKQERCRQAAEWRKEHCWNPNQLRHTRATELRRKYGVEMARTILGHSDLSTTEIYAEQDREAARKIMSEVG